MRGWRFAGFVAEVNIFPKTQWMRFSSLGNGRKQDVIGEPVDHHLEDGFRSEVMGVPRIDLEQ